MKLLDHVRIKATGETGTIVDEAISGWFMVEVVDGDGRTTADHIYRQDELELVEAAK